MLPNLPYLVGDTAALSRAQIVAPSHGPSHLLRVLALVNRTTACRDALEYAKTLLFGRCSEITLAHCLSTDHYEDSMQGFVALQAQGFSVAGFPSVKCEIFNKTDDQLLSDVLADLVDRLRPDLVIIGSTALSKSSSAQGSLSTAVGKPALNPLVTLPSLTLASKQTRHSFALKLCQLIRMTPLLLIKSGSRTRKACAQQLQGLPASPLKCMLELQPTSRYMLEWMVKVMDPSRDKLFLAVTRAYDSTGARKAAAVRIMTAFSVQAGSSMFRPMHRYLREAAGQALPRSVAEDQVDVLMVQGPRSKDLSPTIVDVLCFAGSCVVIWPPESERGVLASRQSDSGLYDTMMPSLNDSPVMLRPRAMSTDTGCSSVHGSQEWPLALAPVTDRHMQQRQQAQDKISRPLQF